MAENRIAPRQRMLKGGRIAFNDGHSTIDCVIRDLSATGARLKVENTVGVPDTFELVLDEGVRKPCTVVWRRANLIGVAFSA